MNLALPGHARTGTTSMWRMFRDHPQIATSFEKEYLIDHFADKNYLNGFKINSNTKLLFDGSPDTPLLRRCFEKIKNTESIKDVFCIFVLRDIKERLISMSTVSTRVYLRGTSRFPYRPLEGGYLDLHKLDRAFTRHSLEFRFLRRFEKYLDSRENIIVVHLEDVEDKQKELQEFLGLDYTKLRFKKLNTVDDYTPTIKSLLLKHEIMEFLDKNINKYYDIVNYQRKKIFERYKVI